MDFSRVDMVLDGYYPQMERDLVGLLAIPSTLGAAEPYAPYGRAVADAIHYALGVAQSLGMEVEDLDGYCGRADVPGASEEQIGILAHVDVVPAVAAEWKYAPFAPALADGKIYGRGAMDDKGPLIAALYGAAALADCGVPLEKTVRFIIGGNEENGMDCVEYYLTKYAQPSCGFTPDASFPAIIGEKGIFVYSLSASWADDDSAPLKLLRAEAGTAPNVVPGRAEAEFACPDDLPLPELPGLVMERAAGRLIVRAEGRAGHASMPELCENALTLLLSGLRGLDFAPAGAKRYLTALADMACADPMHGAGFGVAGSDALSETTNVPSILRLADNAGSLTCDMRFQLKKCCDDYPPLLQALAAAHGMTFSEKERMEPLYFGEQDPVAGKLVEVYREMTGDLRDPLVIGGGTYAKKMKHFVAFGPEHPEMPNLAHQADECIESKYLLFLAKLYARAIYALAR